MYLFFLNKDIDRCKSALCHSNATCTNHGVNNTFSCQCKEGYNGNGFTCQLPSPPSQEKEKVVHECTYLYNYGTKAVRNSMKGLNRLKAA